jgi:ribonuclease D
MLTEKITLYKDDLPESLIITGDIAIDTETMGLNNSRDRLCLVQIADKDGNVYIVQISKNVTQAPYLAKLLSNPDNQKIFHFARFDVAVIQQYLNISVNNIFCTKIASKLARTYTEFHGLKDLCRELLGVQISKQQQSSDWGGELITREQQIYAANDVLYLHKIRDKLNTILIRENRISLAQDCFNFIQTRSLLDLAGWNSIDIFAH